jgi:hypothetical protein
LLRADYLVLDGTMLEYFELSFSDQDWLLDRKFLNEKGNALYFFRRG